MTRNEKKLLVLSNKRKRLMAHIRQAGKNHKSTKYLQARLVDATAAQIRAELRAEKVA